MVDEIGGTYKIFGFLKYSFKSSYTFVERLISFASALVLIATSFLEIFFIFLPYCIAGPISLSNIGFLHCIVFLKMLFLKVNE